MADKLSGSAIEPGTITSVQLSSELGPVTSQLELVGSGVSLNVSNNAVFSGNIAIGVSSPLARTHIIPKSEFSTAYNNYDGDALFIDDANANTGAGNYGGAISWSRLSNPPSRKAAIAIFQDTADINQNGLAFFVSPGANSSDPLEEALRISSNKNVGIGTENPGSKLHILDSTGPIIRLVRTSNRFDIEADNELLGFISRDSANANAYFSGFNGVGIGTTTPTAQLQVLSSGKVAALLRVTDASSYTSLRLYNDQNSALRALEIDYFGSTASGGERGEVFVTGSYPLAFGTNNTERLRIANTGNIYTAAGSPISYGSGETYEIWNDEQEYSITHSDANWKDMKTFVCSKSGNLKFKFSAFISSGAYYWAWRIVSNGSTTVASGYFSVGLDTGESASVHAYRRFVASVGPVAAGDSLVLQMISSTGGGTPVTGVGQVLYAKEFRAYSTVPVGAPDNGRSLNIFGTNDSRGLTRKFSDGRYYYSDLKQIGSAFDNPVQNLVTLPSSGQTNAAILFKLSVAQGLFGGASGNMHEGMAVAMWTGSAWTLNVDTMVKRVGNLSNVGTLSWSGNTLQYTGNRGSNYDGYLLTLEAWQPTNMLSNALIFHI